MKRGTAVDNIVTGGRWRVFREVPAELPAGEAAYLSLSPTASYLLGKQGIEYWILPQFYDEQTLRSTEDDYFQKQSQWFERLEKLFAEHSLLPAFPNIPFAALNYYRLKSLIDSLFVQHYMLKRFLDNAKPSSIEYFETSGDKTISIAAKHYFFKQLLETECRLRQIELRITLGAEALPTLNKSPQKGLLSIRPLRSFLRSVFNVWRYRKLTLQKSDWRDVSILFVNSGTDRINHVIREYIRRGAKVYICYGNEIRRADKFTEPLAALRDDSPNKVIRDSGGGLYAAFSQDQQLKEWLHQNSGSEEGFDLLRPAFEKFFIEFLPKQAKTTQDYRDFYVKQGIQYVAATSITDINNIPPLAAAATLSSVKTICFGHGTQLLRTPVYPLTELHPFDYYFSGDDPSLQILQDYNVMPGIKPSRLHVMPGRYISNAPQSDSAANCVLYIPSKLTAFHKRVMNNMVYPTTWYFEFQKILIDYFGSRKDRQFIYKGVTSAPWMREALVPFLTDRAYPNVELSTKPLDQCWRNSSRVILDRPTTALFEAAAAGRPVLCLYHKSLKMFDAHARQWGRSVQSFGTFDEALAHIDAFLNSPAADYQIDLKVTDTRGLEQLFEARHESLSPDRFLLNWNKLQSRAAEPSYEKA